MLAPDYPLGSPLFLVCMFFFPVEDIDLGFLRTKEDIENDKRSFLNDSEWQLLSVSSTYRILRNSAGNFAQIQFNVGSPSYPVLTSPQSVALCIELRDLLYCISSLLPENSMFSWLCPSPWDAVFESRDPEPPGYHHNLQGNQREQCVDSRDLTHLTAEVFKPFGLHKHYHF